MNKRSIFSHIKFHIRGVLTDVRIRLLIAVYLSPKRQYRIAPIYGPYRSVLDSRRSIIYEGVDCFSQDKQSGNVPQRPNLRLNRVQRRKKDSCGLYRVVPRPQESHGSITRKAGHNFRKTEYQGIFLDGSAIAYPEALADVLCSHRFNISTKSKRF